MIHTFLETFVPSAWTDIFVEVLYLRLVHRMHSIGVLILMYVDDRGLIATMDGNLSIAVELRVVLREAEWHLYLAGIAAVHSQGQPFYLGVKGTGSDIAHAGCPLIVSGKGDRVLHLVPLYSLIQFGLGNGDVTNYHLVVAGTTRETESKERNQGTLAHESI